MKESDYLLKRGWLPAPSSLGPAWQHEHISVRIDWPEGFCEPLVTPQRWLQPDCVREQVRRDEGERNDYLEHCSRFGGP